MGFFSGRVTFARYRVGGAAVRAFGPEHLEKLAAHAIGRQRVASGDGIEAGWIAGDHILDTEFDLAKNIVNDALHFGLRIDSQKVPGELLRAYTAIELKGLAANNPSGNPSARQRREARSNAQERLDAEAADGRFLRRKLVPILWDAPTGELLVGTTSITLIDRLYTLFHATFDRKFEPLTAGRLAYWLAEIHSQTRGVDDAAPAPFSPGSSTTEMAWLPDEANRDFLGNEFLLWLWYVLDSESDTIALSDKSEVVGMFARTLTLECPRGQTGKESIASEGPTQLPEARRAIQAGKLPRKAGLTLVRHDHQYEFTLTAETLSVSGAKFPASDESEERARLEERVTLLRDFRETLDLLFEVFTQRRCGNAWSKDLAKIQAWLREEGKPRRTGTG
jgi:hypothetical protein